MSEERRSQRTPAPPPRRALRLVELVWLVLERFVGRRLRRQDAVELTPEGNRLIAHSNGLRIGVVEPRVAARLLKLMADGNKYAAGVTSLGDKDVRIIVREIFQDPANYGKVSFPTAAKSTDLRPYTKGTLVREEMDLEDDLEDDEEDDEIEDLDRVLPPESTTDEAFEDEPDELDEP